MINYKIINFYLKQIEGQGQYSYIIPQAAQRKHLLSVIKVTTDHYRLTERERERERESFKCQVLLFSMKGCLL